MSALALIVYLVLLWSLASRAWQAVKRDPDGLTRAIAYGALAGLVGNLAASFAGTYMLWLGTSGILWILLGTAARRGAEVLAAGKRPPGGVGRVRPGQDPLLSGGPAA